MRETKRKISGLLPIFPSAPGFMAAFFISFFFLALLGAPLPINAAGKAAAKVPKYAAQELIRSAQKIQLAPGESLDFTIGFKNTGSTAWLAGGERTVTVFTAKKGQSVFYDESWLAENQPGRMVEDVTNSGAIGRFRFTLYAPVEPGTYKENFALYAGKTEAVAGGSFSVEVTVDSQFAKPGQRVPGFKAMMLLVSDRGLNLDAGQTKEFRVAFKNIGRTTWKKAGSQPITLRAENGSAVSFRHPSWSQDVAARLPADEVKPGQLVFLSFSLTAPSGGGQFTPKFTLTAGDGLIEGGEVEIPVEVRAGLVPSQVDELTVSEFAGAGSRGPNVRVGLFSGTDPVVVAADGPYTVYDYNDNAVKTISGVSSVSFDFNSYTYSISSGGWTWTSPRHIRLTPVDPAATIFEISSLQNRPSWDTSINFNRFRGSLEMMFSSKTQKYWTIEELPIEDYIRGLAETTNASPYEYQKALIVAARTYALFIKSIGGKHVSEYHDLNTTAGDQVYKGYVSELVRPNVVRAAEETRGMAVTYNRELVVTPYFSQSDGRTRAWTEVWSSIAHPWLVSKPAPYDQGKPMLGHGVGMSANDAVGRASAGSNWQDILKYYYNGVEIKRLY